MNRKESQNKTTEIENLLTDLEPNGEVIGATGTGVLTLSGANTYTGLTTVNAGTLSVDSRSGVGILKSSDGGNTWTS